MKTLLYALEMIFTKKAAIREHRTENVPYVGVYQETKPNHDKDVWLRSAGLAA